jgi:hypothetical protein
MDLIRLLLLDFNGEDALDLPRYSTDQIDYHKYLLIKSGLAEGAYTASPDRQTRLSGVQIQCITQAGQDFLSYARMKMCGVEQKI